MGSVSYTHLLLMPREPCLLGFARLPLLVPLTQLPGSKRVFGKRLGQAAFHQLLVVLDPFEMCIRDRYTMVPASGWSLSEACLTAS